MSTPSDPDMQQVLTALVPDAADVPRRGLSQPRWWQKEEWLESGCRGVASALREELQIDPDKTTWKIGRDERGARVAVIVLRK
jgi:hypothetical protein